MPPRTRRTRRTQAAPSIDAGPAAAVVANLAALLDENKMLRKEVDKLRGLIERVASLAGTAISAAGTAAPAPTRRRGRASRAEAAPAPAAPVRRPRRKITDPELLERRRAALAKARAVRAERLAAQRGS